jgi:hypothetical protein
MFGLAVPFSPDTEEITVVSNLTPTMAATRTVSANAPSVQVIGPNGGETFTDTLPISWSGSDPDGDELAYTVQYSGDLGQTWRVLAANVLTTSITVDSSTLPGSLSESIIQVIASDGVRTDSDRSDGPFTLPPRSPLAAIHDPAPGAALPAGDPVTLRGAGYDPEDGQLDGSSLSWSVEGLGMVGNGKQVTLYDLAPGFHKATLTATDSNGKSGIDTVTFRIGYQVYLPLVIR